MNERIVELAKLAGYNDQDGIDYVDLEKFALLVIEECRSVAWKEAYSDENAEEISDAIDEHFGIEE